MLRCGYPDGWTLPPRKISHSASRARRKLRSTYVGASGDHLYFLRLGALARLRDARVRRWSRAYRPPLPSSLEPAPTSTSSPPPVARDGKGIVAVPYFVTASRLAKYGGRHPLECRGRHVASVCFKYFRGFICMLQVFFMWMLQK